MKKAGISFFKMFLVVLIFAGCMLDCSCERDEKSKAHYGYAVFNLQWNDSISAYFLPQTLCYCFYPSDGGPMIQTEGDTYNLKVALPPGSYRLLIFSSDLEDMKLRNMARFKQAEVGLPNLKEQMYIPISQIYGTSIDSLKVEAGQELEYEISLIPLVRNITFNVGINNKEVVSSCKASLSGVPCYLNFSTQHIGTCEHISIPFTMEHSDRGFEQNIQVWNTSSEEYSICSEINVLTLDFYLKDGRKLSSKVDLADLLETVEEQEVFVQLSADMELSDSPNITVFHQISKEIEQKIL